MRFYLRTMVKTIQSMNQNSFMFIEKCERFPGEMICEECWSVIMEKITSDGSIMKKVIVIMLRFNKLQGRECFTSYGKKKWSSQTIPFSSYIHRYFLINIFIYLFSIPTVHPFFLPSNSLLTVVHKYNETLLSHRKE